MRNYEYEKDYSPGFFSTKNGMYPTHVYTNIYYANDYIWLYILPSALIMWYISLTTGENEKWDTFLYGIVPRWQKTIVKWFVESIDFRKPILVVRYEDLKNDNLAQVERILNFIHFPFAKEVVEKRLQEDYGVFRRSHSGEDGFEHYTPSQQEMVNLMLFETIGVLKEHKVENLFNLHEYLRT